MVVYLFLLSVLTWLKALTIFGISEFFRDWVADTISLVLSWYGLYLKFKDKGKDASPKKRP